MGNAYGRSRVRHSRVVYHKRNLNLRVYEPDEALRGMPFCLREERKEGRGRGARWRNVDVGFVGKLTVTSGVTTCFPFLGRWGKHCSDWCFGLRYALQFAQWISLPQSAEAR